MDTKKQKLDQLRILVAKSEWVYLPEYLDTLIQNQYRILSTATTMEQVKEVQGVIKAYQHIKDLPSLLRTMSSSSKA